VEFLVLFDDGFSLATVLGCAPSCAEGADNSIARAREEEDDYASKSDGFFAA